MSGLSCRHHGKTAVSMVNYCVQRHKDRYDQTLPYRVTLSSEWREEMQHVTSIMIQEEEVIIRYRRNQDRYTVSCDSTKQGNRRAKP